jgi:hypothetical protein
MASLFGKNKLRDIASKLQTSELEDNIAVVKTWHNDYHNGSLKADKETSREQAYNQDFFIKILGYQEKPAVPYSFEPKATTDKGQLPDAVLSHTDVNQDIKNIAAVVELKGASIELDRPQRREGNMSPVQQGFKYKTQYRNCPFVIVSNFWEFRLYHDNQLDYELWTLDDLVDPEDDYLKFKTFYTLLHSENLTTPKGASKTEGWLSDIRFEQEEIGKKFYKVYREARLELLRDIYQHNESVRTDIDLGIEKAQKIIDRIVFACFAEDRGLLPDDTLRRVIQAADNSTFGGSLWATFKAFFEAIDVGSTKLEIPDGYNGGLFAQDPELNALKVSDEPLRKIASISNYNFVEDLSVTILGHIFEQSISDLEEIKSKVEESQDIDSLQQSRRKKDGIFYTPDFIVRYIVDNSLGAYLREEEERLKTAFKLKGDITDKNYEKRERQAYSKYQDFLQNVKVVDPACGSGAFLVYVFDYLLAENKRVASVLGNSLFSSDDYIKSILQNNIYGVDLNDESVEITKLSLWLKSAQKGKKLTTLDSNIKCGNSLVDDPEIAGNKAFNWQSEFPDIFKHGGFDVVVGNPPYVRQELLGSQKLHFEKHYKVYAGTTDLFAYFYEKALNILKPNGLFSYISNTFAKTTGAGVVLRKYLKENAKIEQLIDFNTLTIFQGATTYPIIFVFRKTTPTGSFKYLSVEKPDLMALDSAYRNRSFDVKQSALNDLSWNFESTASAELRNKIGQYKTIREQYGKSYYGIKTGFNEAFILDQKTRKKIISEDSFSNEVIKPFLEGKDILRWTSFKDDKFVINISQGLTKQLFGDVSEEKAFEAMTRKYPAIMRHLSHHEAKVKARYDKGDYWWEMRACAYEDLFQQNKITWTNLQNRGKFCFDESGKYINAPAVILPTDDKSLLGILNSKVAWYFLQGICVQRSGGYLEVKPQYFEQLPLPEKTEEWSEKMKLKVEEMLENIKEKHLSNKQFKNVLLGEIGIEKWSNKLSNWWTLDFNDFTKALKLKLSLSEKDELYELFEKYRTNLTELDNKIKNTDAEIDQLVYELYELTAKEIAIVESR